MCVVTGKEERWLEWYEMCGGTVIDGLIGVTDQEVEETSEKDVIVGLTKGACENSQEEMGGPIYQHVVRILRWGLGLGSASCQKLVAT